MGNIVLIILGIYFVYYSANIVYDLFLKKETVIADTDTSLTFSIAAEADAMQEEVQNSDYEEMENVTMPSYMQKIRKTDDEISEEDMRSMFEEEQNMVTEFIDEKKELPTIVIQDDESLEEFPEISDGSEEQLSEIAEQEDEEDDTMQRFLKQEKMRDYLANAERFVVVKNYKGIMTFGMTNH